MKNLPISLFIFFLLTWVATSNRVIKKREVETISSTTKLAEGESSDISSSKQPQSDLHHHSAKHWGYRNQDKSILPNDWFKNHPKCYGKQQSPVNVETNKAYVDENLDDVNIMAIPLEEASQEIWEIQNNGHSVVLYPKNHKFGFVAENSNYELLQMHFHWRGSEHFINGHRYAAELHLVHRNLNDTNKFAVLGFLFEQTNQDNHLLKPIVDNLDQITLYNSKSTLTQLSLERLIPFKIDKYYRYPGSLTTPACDEVVEWFVIHEPILTISDPQILEFQSVEDKNGYPILTNSRPIQDINERYVRKSFYGNGNLRIAKVDSKEVENRASMLELGTRCICLILISTVASIFNYLI